MDNPAPQTIFLADYTPPAYLIDSVDLSFELDPDATIVSSRIAVRRNPQPAQGGAAGHASRAARGDVSPPLLLDGEQLELISVAVNGQPLGAPQYVQTAESLSIAGLPDQFTLEITTRIAPAANTSLMGLYVSNGNFFTQCEAEGFRRITYFPDRPDVMAVYTVTVSGDKLKYPVLLSNGNCVERKDLGDGRHLARWIDPFPKPSYLFALVAGNLAKLEQSIKTKSGKKKLLQIYVEPRDLPKTQHAMDSLIRSIRWDETRFGLELDLDQYMIVAVGDFNMGAMENKGLNVFNTKYVLADAATATDADYDGIESVIAHEYFHNWTGNRVTCRDWFQLSLKEGLTVFRDQEFSMDMSAAAPLAGGAVSRARAHGAARAASSGRAVRRIGDVRVLRAAQFPEDAGPMAHAVRPDAYMEISNFYTVTIYEKGAEVVRMVQTMFGQAGFRRGMDLYFKRHDGQAVTCDDFFAAMADANPQALSAFERRQFTRWYAQAGTPRLAVTGSFDAKAKTYTLRARQSCAPTPGQADKQALVIPLSLALFGKDCKALTLKLSGEARARGPQTTLLCTGAGNVFVFEDIAKAPVPSLLREFSAPVTLEFDYSDADLAFLLAHDDDAFNRWEAGQRLFMRLLTALARRAASSKALGVPANVIKAFRAVLVDRKIDAAFKAEALALPSEITIAEQMEEVDPAAIHTARVFVRHALAQACQRELRAAWQDNAVAGPYRPDPVSAGQRALQGLALGLLMELGTADVLAVAAKQYAGALNMTDRMNALGALMLSASPERATALDAFYRQFAGEALVVDKWLALQAGARGAGTLARVRELMQHEAFSMRNPNKVRALIGTFCHGNPARFHAPDGSGYAFWSACVIELDAINPQVAARLARAAAQWKKLEPGRRALLHAALAGVAGQAGLSKDTFEVVTKSLA